MDLIIRVARKIHIPPMGPRNVGLLPLNVIGEDDLPLLLDGLETLRLVLDVVHVVAGLQHGGLGIEGRLGREGGEGRAGWVFKLKFCSEVEKIATRRSNAPPSAFI
jgi:hypothetical protein